MPEDSSQRSANTSDVDGKNTGASSAGETHASKSQIEGSQSQSEADNRTFTQADFDAYAERTRKELKKLIEKEFKDAQLPETERTAKRVQELENEIRQRDAKEAVQDAARKAGAANPQAVYRLIRGDLEWDQKSGELSNLRDLMDGARQDAPELFPKRPGSGNGGEGSAGTFSRNMNDLIRRSAGRQ